MHGPVFERGMVNGKPVAFVRNRYFWKKELDSIAAFYKWNTRVRNIKDFRKAASEFSMNFNAFYADANDIGWFHVGYLPKRPRGMHPSLPTWGTGRWEFKKKRFPFRRHPQVINPDQGWISNWNNKPAVGWDNTDHCCGGKWGSVQRVSLLQDQMSELLGGAGKAELSDLVDVIRVGATQDTRGVYLGSRMLKWANSIAGSDQKLADAHDLVKKWVNAGAHRYNKNEDDQMDESAALALFDEWWELLVHRVYDDEIGKEGYDLLRVPLTDYSPTGGSSFFFDFASYLKNVFDAKTKKKLAVDYCNDRSTPKRETCKSVTAETFKAAYDALVREQGANTAEWTLPAENIVFQELGAGSADPIPWQNRGTHNHVVEVLRDLNLPYPKPGGSGSPSPSPSGS
jgi:penicillin amidase